ncbi:MAG: DNA-binding protein [Betaproteobacteria bacterium]|nr:DNA-binding protein [Betaproteobacteria bacterium]
MADTYSTPQRRGLVPVGKTWLFEQISAGRLKTRKIGQRATVVAGADLIKLLGGAQ